MEPHQIIIIIILVLIETLGNVFLFGIFIYEKYGINANRRTVQNMLISQICLDFLFCQTFALPFWVYGYFFSESGIGMFYLDYISFWKKMHDYYFDLNNFSNM